MLACGGCARSSNSPAAWMPSLAQVSIMHTEYFEELHAGKTREDTASSSGSSSGGYRLILQLRRRPLLVAMQ